MDFRGYIPNSRDITEEQYKVIAMLENAIPRIADKWHSEISIEEEDGKYIITVGQDLNAMQIQITNGLQQFDKPHPNDPFFNECMLESYKSGYRPYDVRYFTELARIVMEDQNFTEESQRLFNPKHIGEFASYIAQSEHVSESFYQTIVSEYDYWREQVDGEGEEE